jgi:hypothetical protein
MNRGGLVPTQFEKCTFLDAVECCHPVSRPKKGRARLLIQASLGYLHLYLEQPSEKQAEKQGQSTPLQLLQMKNT